MYAGVLDPVKLAAGLMAARSWLAETKQLKVHMAELLAREERSDIEADGVRDEAIAWIGASQDQLLALGQQVSSLKQPRGAVAADSADMECPDAGLFTKRPRPD